jgi:sugar/nucleoside kinase (ribokinase family)
MNARLLCVGDTIIDVTATVDSLPERGGDVLADSGAMLAGGTGFNVMAAASRLGLPSAYGGMHGTGPFGDLARAAMRREGIEILLEPDTETDTGWDVAITDAGSERTFVTVVGAEARLTAERIATLEARPGDAVYVSGYGLLHEPNRSAITRWLEALSESVTVVTDPGPLVADIPHATLETVLARTTWWSCNLAEATATTGESAPEEAARSLASRTSGVVIRLGADGCLVLAPDGRPVPVPGSPVKAVDSNGAGDTHVGAFLASLLAGLEPVAAARRANAAAAFAVIRRGPATGPTTEELDRFLSS